jgi:hypothetical protein
MSEEKPTRRKIRLDPFDGTGLSQAESLADKVSGAAGVNRRKNPTVDDLKRSFDESKREELDDIAKGSPEDGVHFGDSEKELRQAQIRRLLLRGVPKVTIMGYLGISQNTLYVDIREVEAKLKAVAGELDIQLEVGKQLDVFDEVRFSMARLMSDTRHDSNPRIKMEAARVLLQGESARHVYMERLGLFTLVDPASLFPGMSRQKDAANEVSLVEVVASLTHAVKEAIGEVPDTVRDLREDSSLPDTLEAENLDYASVEFSGDRT